MHFRAKVLSLALLAILDITLTAWGAEWEAPVPRLRAEVEAVLAKAPKPVAGERLPALHVVLLADVKDHGPGAHDYPLWQQRWALLLGGRQADLGLSQAADATIVAASQTTAAQRAAPLPPRLSEADVAAHQVFVKDLGKKALWLKYLS